LGDSNPFHILLVVTVLILMATSIFAIAAPQFGFNSSVIKQQPQFPSFSFSSEGNPQANSMGQFAYNETHQIVGNGQTVYFKTFTPDKQIQSITLLPELGIFGSYQGGYRFLRYATWGWANEPVTDLEGNYLNAVNTFGADHFSIPAQTIVDDENGVIMKWNDTIKAAYENQTFGVYSTFIIDNNNPQYMAYVSFSPLPGYHDLTTSWNVGHGFTVWVYGNAFQKPAWTDQVVDFFLFLGDVIGFFVGYVYWIAQMSGLMVTFLSAGFIPAALGSALIILVGILFLGSLLMFIRGNSGSK